MICFYRTKWTQPQNEPAQPQIPQLETKRLQKNRRLRRKIQRSWGGDIGARELDPWRGKGLLPQR